MAVRFDSDTLRKLNEDLLVCKNNPDKKPNGVLSDCVGGLEKLLGETSEEFARNTTPIQRSALRASLRATDATLRLEHDTQLFSALRREKNRLRSLRTTRVQLDRMIALSGHLAREWASC